MHELGVARSVVQAACAAARDEGAARVSSVHLRIGALSGVAPRALAFAWPAATAGTPAEGSRLEVEEVPVVVWCPACGLEGAVGDPALLRCPSCGARTGHLRAGRDLEIAAVEVVDASAGVAP